MKSDRTDLLHHKWYTLHFYDLKLLQTANSILKTITVYSNSKRIRVIFAAIKNIYKNMFNSNNTKKRINCIYCPAIREVDSSRRSCNLLHAAVWSQVACVIDLVHANTYFKDFFIVRGSVSLSTSFKLAIDSYLPSPREKVRQKIFITGLFRQILRGSVPVWAFPTITTSPHRPLDVAATLRQGALHSSLRNLTQTMRPLTVLLL